MKTAQVQHPVSADNAAQRSNGSGAPSGLQAALTLHVLTLVTFRQTTLKTLWEFTAPLAPPVPPLALETSWLEAF